MIYNNLFEMVGNTPLVRLKELEIDGCAQIYIKLEYKNPSGSIKDRAALSMLLGAINKGNLKPGMKIVEATSGNTGIALALFGSYLGYDVDIICLVLCQLKEGKQL
jgi:cysteine synthase